MQVHHMQTASERPAKENAIRVAVRVAQSPDERQLFRTVGTVVDDLYPRGREKLMAKLLVNESLGDHSYVAALGEDIVGYAAETPKSPDRLKLSTFWVREDARRQGVGTLLADFLVERWERARLNEVYVTVRLGRDQELLSLLSRYGFERIAVIPERYGVGRDEVVLARRRNASTGLAHTVSDASTV